MERDLGRFLSVFLRSSSANHNSIIASLQPLNLGVVSGLELNGLQNQVILYAKQLRTNTRISVKGVSSDSFLFHPVV
jgi:hypothetical protein